MPVSIHPNPIGLQLSLAMAPTPRLARGAGPSPAALHPVALPSDSLAALAIRLAIQGLAGGVFFLALCLPLHWLWFLVWMNPLVTLGMAAVAAILAAAILDQPLREVEPLWLAAAVQALVAGALFGAMQSLMLARPDRVVPAIQTVLLGSIVGVAAAAQAMHLLLPIAWAAARLARRASTFRASHTFQCPS